MHWSFTRSPLILSYPKIVKWMAIILCFDIPILPPKLWHALKWSFKIGNKDKKLDVEIFRLVRLYISLLLNFNSRNESFCRAVGTRGTRAYMRYHSRFFLQVGYETKHKYCGKQYFSLYHVIKQTKIGQIFQNFH